MSREKCVIIEYMTNWKDALTEAIKEFIRTGLLGGLAASLAIVISGLSIYISSGPPLIINYQLALVVFAFTALTALTRALDKFIHEWNGTKLKGISPI